MKITMLLLVLLALSGCAGTQETAAPAEENPRKLLLSVVELETPGYTSISRETLGDASLEMAYGGLKEVNIRLDGQDVPLAQAIGEGRLTLMGILSYARQDAAKGFCQEQVTSEHGVATYCYAYPECQLYITSDLYEMPDGSIRQIEELVVYKPSQGQRSHSRRIVDESSKWGYFEDREDWGITFTVLQATPTAVTIGYTQQGGQQIGELQIFDYLLYPAQDYGNPEKFPDHLEKTGTDTMPIALLSDAAAQFTLDWAQAIGPVEPGEYYLKLSIEDIYEEADVHPLMENFYDKQSYYIEFTIE